MVYHPHVDYAVTSREVDKYPRIETLEYSPVLGEYALKASAAISEMHHTDRRFHALFATAVKRLYGDEVSPEVYEEEYLSNILPEEQRWPNIDESLVVGDDEAWFPVDGVFQMGGYPAFVQYEFREEDSPYDTLLMQLPTIESDDDEHPYRTIWGDCGEAILAISEADLRRRDFSRVRFDTQCY